MKSTRIIYSVFTLLLINATLSFSQNLDKMNLMVIREDRVSPALTEDYEMALMDLKEFLTEKNIQGFNYFVHLREDYVYTHVIPVDRLEDLSNGLHSFIAKKINDPELDIILDYLNDATESNRYYITQFRPELSYIPGELDWGDKITYRKWSYYRFESGSEDEVENTLLAWKKLYGQNGIKMGFRVYSGFIGIEQSTYILSTWAEGPLEYHQNLQAASEILGPDGASMWAKMMAEISEVEVVEGWFLPQYSYTQGMVLAK
jgi:hypothetical protein